MDTVSTPPTRMESEGVYTKPIQPFSEWLYKFSKRAGSDNELDRRGVNENRNRT